MHRIDGPGATVDNKFTEGDPVGGVQATVVTDDWLNDVQEELMTLLSTSGITPVKGSQNQILAAIRKLKGVQRFTASGSFTVPAGVTQIWLSACAGGSGGGGGGGATNATGTGAGGAGGSAGQTIIRQPYTVTPGQVITVTIGAGGSAGSAGTPTVNGGSGGVGGNTVIGSLITLTGALASSGGLFWSGSGVPGGGLPSATGFPSGSCGGDGANGFNGGVGMGGMGASTPFGGGGGNGRSGSTGSTGAAAIGFGGGGGGGGGGYGSSGGGANGGLGGVGAPGLVIFEW